MAEKWIVLKMDEPNNPQTRPFLQKADFQTKYAIFLLYGFFFLDKLLVYISLPFTTILLFDRRVFFDRVYSALTTPGPLSGVTWALLISTMFGIAEVAYGLLEGYGLTSALEILVFNLCPWFLFFGIVAGMQRPWSVRNYIRFLAYFHAIEGPIYYLFLRHVSFKIGSTDVSFAPGTGSLALLGLFCFEQRLSRYWFPILVCSFDTIAGEMRADWLGFGMAVVVWAIAARQIKRVLTIAAILIALLAIGFVTDVRIPGLPGRGGEISARDTVARALSGIDPELAQQLSPGAMGYGAGTIAWRENWWRDIRGEVFKSPVTAIFGLGYGYPIGQLVPALRNVDIRSPHSVFHFTLANSGLLGFFLFVLLQMQLLRVLWKTFKQTGQIFGLACAIFAIENSMFGNFFEAPQRAIPTYILLGMCIGPLFLAATQQSTSDDVRKGGRALIPLLHEPAKGWPTSPESVIR